MYLSTRDYSGMKVLVVRDAWQASLVITEQILKIIQTAQDERGRAVLGLATGSTPETVYAQLVERHRTGSLSFQNVTTYNLDEYYPISPLDPKSYRYYMHRHLFSHVDIVPHRAHVLDGTVPEAYAAEHAAQFDRWIDADGGLDLQLLGIGRNGHIGFNEPTDLTVEQALGLPTRLVELHMITRADAAREFGGVDHVIPRALTMGVAPILAARSILMLATGAHMIAELPASLLQSVGHKVTWILDEPAAQGLADSQE
jgi:glucosamine-6-phosphate deaminase